MANQTYFCTLTAIGEAKDANAKALGTALKLTEMAVGDGNGALPIPDRTRTSLVRQVRRAPINTLKPDPLNAGQLIAEQIIPENVGGWWIRELGLYDDAGDLIAIGNCPETYKPQLVEGSGRVQVVRMVLIMSSASTVQLKIDPSVVLATRKYVDDQGAAHVADQDPHPQYMTDPETTAKIAAAIAGKADLTGATFTSHVGIGGVPKAWGTSALQVRAVSITESQDGAEFVYNAYRGADATWRSIASGNNFRYVQGLEHRWYSGYSNAPDAAIVWSQFMTLDTTGNFLVGTPSGTKHIIEKDVSAGSPILAIRAQGESTVEFMAAKGYTPNTSRSAAQFGHDLTTGRAINTGGTINASGADYAEYMTKAPTCGDLAKGQIVGVNVDGQLVDIWADAVSFLIKSTDPSYVGGDVWGSEVALGRARPVEPVLQLPEYIGAPHPGEVPTLQKLRPPGDDASAEELVAWDEHLAQLQALVADYEQRAAAYKSDQATHVQLVAAAREAFDAITMPAYEKDLVKFNELLEQARQRVDRMAYCGQVPVNVEGAKPGQYVVPVRDGEGIAGQLVDADAITFDQYRRAVGIVQNILPDGRANVRVKPV